MVEAINASGIRFAGPDDRVLGPDEVDPVTLEEAAEVGKEAAKVGDCHHVAAAIRALGRKP